VSFEILLLKSGSRKDVVISVSNDHPCEILQGMIIPVEPVVLTKDGNYYDHIKSKKVPLKLRREAAGEILKVLEQGDKKN